MKRHEMFRCSLAVLALAACWLDAPGACRAGGPADAAGLEVVTGDPRDWPMYNHDPLGSRASPAETALRPDNVGSAVVLWSLPTAAMAGTPAVVDDIVYAADAVGVVRAVTRDGALLWSTTLPVDAIWGPKLTASPLVIGDVVVIGDLGGDIHGLDATTGQVLWTTEADPHPGAAIFGSGTSAGRYVAIGVSSLEEILAVFPGYPCCSFRGAMLLLDPVDGSTVWKTPTITDAEHAAGSSGAAIWSSPTYDRATRTIYATTGNNYSQPTTDTSDAFIAFDAEDGHVVWVNQRTAMDEWNFLFLPEDDEHPDFDFGDSPQIYRSGSRKLVGAGQKSGFYHVVDALTGETVDQIQAAPPGQLGGIFADSAFSDGVAFVNGSHWPFVFTGGPPLGGVLAAVAGDASEVLWSVETPTPNICGVAVAGDVVYFQSTFDGSLHALDAATGEELLSLPTGGQTSGPSISRGRLYLGTGDILALLLDPFLTPGPGSLIAVGLPN